VKPGDGDSGRIGERCPDLGVDSGMECGDPLVGHLGAADLFGSASSAEAMACSLIQWPRARLACAHASQSSRAQPTGADHSKISRVVSIAADAKAFFRSEASTTEDLPSVVKNRAPDTPAGPSSSL